jgi:hypothetical protein
MAEKRYLIRHPEAQAQLVHELEAFELVALPKGLFMEVSYEATPAVFELSQEELDAADPWAYPHHYLVVVKRRVQIDYEPRPESSIDFVVDKMVLSKTVSDLPGTIRLLREAIEFGMTDDGLPQWVDFMTS